MGDIDFRRVVQAFADAVIASDRDGLITFANTAAERLLGWSAGELVGRPLTEIMPERLRAAHHAGFRRYVDTGEKRVMHRPVRLAALHRSGREIDVELTLTAVPDGGGREVFVGSMRDLSERVELERQASVRRHLEAATRLAARLGSRLDVEHVLRTTAAALVDDFGAALGRVWIHDPSSGSLALRASAGRAPDVARARIDLATYPYEVGVVARTRAPFVSNDLKTAPHMDQAWVAREKLEAAVVMPLVDGEALRGVIACFFPRQVGDELVSVLATIAAIVTSSLRDVELFRREQAARTRLTAQVEAASALVNANTREEALYGVLEAIGRNLEWEVAHAWIVDPRAGRMKIGASWRAAGSAPGFALSRTARTFARGEGMVGLAWERAQPIWTEDALREEAFARFDAAELEGMHGALWFPLRVRGEVVGVIELFTRAVRPSHERLLETMTGLGDQLGQFLERASAEEALHETEERLATTLRSIGDGVIATDVEQRVTFMNPVAEAITGWSLAEARGKSLDDVCMLVREDDRTLLESPAAHVLREGRVVIWSSQTALVSRNGTVFSVESSGAPIRREGGDLLGVVIVFRDVTQARRARNRGRFLAQAAASLASSLDYGETLTNVAHLAVPRLADWCVVHVTEDDGTLRPLAIAHANPAKVGWARELQKRWPDHPNAKRGVPNVVRTGKSEVWSDPPPGGAAEDAEEQVWILRELGIKSAMIVPLVAHGRVLGAITFVTESDHRYDEADLAMAEELAARAALAIDNARLHRSLQEGEERIRLVLESAGEAILGVDMVGRCVFANPACARLLGMPDADALVGKDVREVLHHDEASKGPPSRIDELCLEGEGVHVPEERLRRADASGFWAECWSYPIVREGRRVGAVITFVDITERKRAEEEHSRLLVELEEAVRLRDDFLSIASHELRTPLTPLQLHVQGIQRAIRRGKLQELSPAELYERLDAVARQIQRMERLVDSLLDIARITGKRMHLQPEPLDLAALVRDVIARHKAEMDRAGCTAVVEIEGGLEGAWDRLRLDQVISNLLSNAIKFGAGKPIEVRVLRTKTGTARLLVRDHGIGIAPEDQRRIFERFERAVPTRHYGGFGLGLWIVRQIVEAMGGTIGVQSAQGEGATFVVELPIVATATAAQEPAQLS